MTPAEPISPELVLVAPELRTHSPSHAAVADGATPAPAAERRVRRLLGPRPSLTAPPLAIGVVAAITYAASAFTP